MGRVLICDDSAVARVSVARLVRATGHDVVEKDGAASGSSVDATSLSCALLDLDLGDGSGADVATSLRATNAALPIAFFTSEKTGAELERARAIGPIFAKPDEIDAAVEWIGKHA